MATLDARPSNGATPTLRVPGTVFLVNAFTLTQIGLQIALKRLSPTLVPMIADGLDTAKTLLGEASGTVLVILDIDPPGTFAMSKLRELRSIRADALIVVLSSAHDAATVNAASELGAAGYIAKLAGVDAIVATLRKVIDRREAFVKDSVEAAVLEARSRQVDQIAQIACPRLTPRQSATLALLRMGLPNKSIARSLNISGSTVKVHVSNILQLFGVRNRTELVAKTQTVDFEASAGGAENGLRNLP